jgi:hypothetical protein
MKRPGMKSLIGAAAAFALCFSPTMAHAATAAATPSLNPLVAVSVFGTPASAQAVCGNASGAAAAAGAAAVAQGQTGCVLPAVDAPPPPVSAVPPAEPVSRGFGIAPILLGLLGLAALAALIATSDDDDDDDVDVPASP